MTATHEVPRIWVGCLGAYNAGVLLGEWIDATEADTKVNELNADWYKENPEFGDEWFIADHEGFGNAWPGGEWPDLDNLAKLAEALEEHGEAFKAYAEYEDGADDIIEVIKKFEEAYLGDYENVTEYAWDFLEDTGALAEIPDYLVNYFDFKAYGRDLEHNGDIFAVEKKGFGVHIFNNHV